MWQFALVVIEAFNKFFTFFDKFRISQNASILFHVARWATKKTAIAILISLALIYIGLVIAFAYFTFEAVTTAYNFISEFLNKVQSPSNAGSSVLQTFYFLSNSFGLTTALNAIFPFFASALTFRLLKVVKSVFLQVYDKFYKILAGLIAIITAS